MENFNLNEEERNNLKRSLLSFVKRVSERGGNLGEVQIYPEIVKLLLDIPLYLSVDGTKLNLDEVSDRF